MGRARSETWVWHFDSPVAAIWPVLSDTARFNEAAKLPKHDITEVPQSDDSVRFYGRARMGPFALEWEEKPVNWVEHKWFEHRRNFSSGPLEFLCAQLRMFAEQGGCRVEYTVEAAPRNLFGRFMLATQFFARTEQTFGRLADNAREYARGERATQFDCAAPRLTPGALERSTAMVAAIEQSTNGHGLAQRLADFVLQRQETDVWSIRPLQLARVWQVCERFAIEVCLEAVRQGLLRVRWDLLCPRCQVGKSSSASLDELPTGAHCSSCNIDYDREYSANLELVFTPGHSIRTIESGEYCLFGPMSTPHIKLQITLAPGEEQVVAHTLDFGEYRVRTLEPGPEAMVVWREDGFPMVGLGDADIDIGAPGGREEITLRNHAGSHRTIIIEERVWNKDALTAARVTALQAFRDIFNEDVLRPGDDVEIDHITILFTDLKSSTALYERIGDPAAYHLVREHFALLGQAVREHDGAVVKTIGDAIMAVFTNPGDGFDCCVEIHTLFAEFNKASGKEAMTVKLGLHLGRCISVTLNNRLDYYGTVANMAARLQGQSTGGDMVLSREFAADPEVAKRLVDYTPNEEFAPFKGFDEPVGFWRISAAELDAKRQSGAHRGSTLDCGTKSGYSPRAIRLSISPEQVKHAA